jgi:alkylated DNA repair protein alkB family protein 6
MLSLLNKQRSQGGALPAGAACRKITRTAESEALADAGGATQPAAALRAALSLPAAPLSPAFTVSPPPYASVAYHACAVAPGDAAALVAAIDGPAAQWVELRGRRLQQHGGAPAAGAPPLPPYLASLAAQLVAAGVFPREHAPNHVLINDYAAGEGILAHTDGPRYHPCVATLSLLDDAVMRFSVLHGREVEGERGGQVVGELLLRANSLVVTWGECYSRYAHGIAEEAESVLGGSLWNAGAAGAGAGQAFARQGRRVSITIRHVLAP